MLQIFEFWDSVPDKLKDLKQNNFKTAYIKLVNGYRE